jgi:hypothetical protein
VIEGKHATEHHCDALTSKPFLIRSLQETLQCGHTTTNTEKRTSSALIAHRARSSTERIHVPHAALRDDGDATATQDSPNPTTQSSERTTVTATPATKSSTTSHSGSRDSARRAHLLRRAVLRVAVRVRRALLALRAFGETSAAAVYVGLSSRHVELAVRARCASRRHRDTVRHA